MVTQNIINYYQVWTRVLTREISLVRTRVLVRETWGYIWYKIVTQFLKLLDTSVKNQTTRRYLKKRIGK